MGRLLRETQVHPGHSGFEKVGSVEIDHNGDLLTQLQTLSCRHASNHVIV